MKYSVGGLVAALLLVAGAPCGQAQERDAPSCFAGAQVDALEQHLQPLVVQTDELARIAVDEKASPQTIYVVTRQLAMLESLRRRSLERRNFDFLCDSALDAISRQFRMLATVYSGLQDGNSELGIDKLQSPPAQAMLKRINEGVATASDSVSAITGKPASEPARKPGST
jgi:hypothetical protein